MDCRPNKRFKVQELNITIEIDKCDTNSSSSIIMDDSEDKSFLKQPHNCVDNEDNGCMSQNSQNLTKAGTGEKGLSGENFELMHLAINSTILIDALESIPALKKKCGKLGVKGHFGYQKTSCEKKYENLKKKPCGQYYVERILDHNTVDHLYLTKWIGFDVEFNTWEPIDHFHSNSDLVFNFRLMERRLSEDNKVAYKKLILLDCLLDEILSPANQDPYLVLKLSRKSVSYYKPEDLTKLKKKLAIRRTPLKKCLMDNETKFRVNYERFLEKTMKDLFIIVAFESIEKLQDVSKHRRRYFKSLKFWEEKINHTISQEEGCAPIKIENNCDFDSPPNDFTYITKCISGPDVNICEEPIWFCNCENDCISNTETCCPSINDSKHIYNRHGSVKSLKQTTIFECNSKCKCPSTCSNRVIQNGRKFKLGIFKTEDNRGWGVKALERIPKGRFIVEYVGEIVTEEEAARRSTLGENPFHKTYLFDLEYETGTNCHYVLDGAKYGNVSRFVNHSCSPNMEVYMFWVDNPDVTMPRIAFFSQESIAKGEELTFDYRMSAPGDVDTNENDNPFIKVPCKCLSSKCRKFLF